MLKEQMTVVSQRSIARHIFELTVEGGLAERMEEPGQFVHVKVSPGLEPLLRRPISICDADPENRQFTMIYRAEGIGTQLLSQATNGEKLDILGPLGNGFPLQAAEKGQTALLVGGGIGVPPLYMLSKRLNARGVRTIHVLGWSSAEDAFYIEKFQDLGDTYVATVDGSLGRKGFVTDVIREEKLQFDVLYACGPTPMLRVLDETYRDQAVKGFLSLEERMGCGIGACYACVCQTRDPHPDTAGADAAGAAGYVKVCKDGPVFAIGEVQL